MPSHPSRGGWFEIKLFLSEERRCPCPPSGPLAGWRAFLYAAKKGCHAKNSDTPSKNEEFAPEGFQRAVGKPFGGALGQSFKLKKAIISRKVAS